MNYDQIIALTQERDALAAELDQAKRHKQTRGAALDEAHKRIGMLEAALRSARAHIDGVDGMNYDDDRRVIEVIDRVLAASETPDQMHARIVTETADATAKERGLTAETHSFDCPSLESGPCDCSAQETASKQPDRYAAHHPQCEWRQFEGQAICNCADLTQ